MRTPFTGAGTALITPFTRSGDLDEAAVRRLGRRQIDAGIHFLAPCGTTGENPTLTASERRRIVEILAEEAGGKVPILAGAGGYNTKEVIELARELAKAGADGFLSVTPYYNKPTQEGLYQHYRAIAESTSLPIVVYNVPGRTGVNVEVATLVRLAAIPNIIGVKEASGSMQQMCEVCRAVPPEFPRAVRRRCDGAAADGGRRTRRHLRGVERNAGRGRADDRSGRAQRLRRGARDSPPHHAADARQFRRIQSRFRSRPRWRRWGWSKRPTGCRSSAPKPESKEKIVKTLKDLGLAEGSVRVSLESEIARARRRRPVGRSRRRRARCSRGCGRRCRPATVRAAEPDAGSPDRLARQHVGEAGHSPRLQVRRHRRRVDGSRQAALLRQGHAAAEASRASRPAFASCPAAPRFGTARMWRPGSSACRRCT